MSVNVALNELLPTPAPRLSICCAAPLERRSDSIGAMTRYFDYCTKCDKRMEWKNGKWIAR